MSTTAELTNRMNQSFNRLIELGKRESSAVNLTRMKIESNRIGIISDTIQNIVATAPVEEIPLTPKKSRRLELAEKIARTNFWIHMDGKKNPLPKKGVMLANAIFQDKGNRIDCLVRRSALHTVINLPESEVKTAVAQPEKPIEKISVFCDCCPTQAFDTKHHLLAQGWTLRKDSEFCPNCY